jgi:hypothetical protein
LTSLAGTAATGFSAGFGVAAGGGALLQAATKAINAPSATVRPSFESIAEFILRSVVNVFIFNRGSDHALRNPSGHFYIAVGGVAAQ